MATGRAPIIQFVGGTRTVTGSKTLIDMPDGRRLLVDCGLFQGRKELRLLNWKKFPVPPESVDAVVLTHAHLDHCGYLPRLVRTGFEGPVYCTPGTRALAGIVLPDSAHLQEEEAEFANRMGFSKHDPAQPLYTAADAERCLDRLRPVEFGDAHEVLPGIDVSWRRAGHILGAASLVVRIRDHDTTVVFSGDLGRPSHPLLLPPDPIDDAADVVVVESTYGDEEHTTVDAEAAITEVVNDAVRKRGVVIVPAFAVDRTEVVLWHLDRVVADGRVPSIPVVLDSPMARSALDFYRAEVGRGSPEIRPELFGRTLFPSLDLSETTSVEDSKALGRRDGPMVIVSASGMATGGRVVHHLAQRIGDSRNTVLLVGFQAPGTRGDLLRSGATTIKMLGGYHPVRASVVAIDLSSHADRSELLDWLRTGRSSPATPRITYVNHGEQDAALALVGEIGARLGVSAVAPTAGERVRLD